jgi:glycogen debranching enzyme
MADHTDKAWERLDEARMSFDGRDIGVRASTDRTRPALNYDQCFVRDFALCAPAFLQRGDDAIVRQFLIATLELQKKEEALEAFVPRRGLMPASFRPELRNGRLMLEPDYGEESIARVTPVDSVFWWLLTLRAYTRVTGDRDLAGSAEFQEGIRAILQLALQGSFELFPTLLVPEGSFMIDRRMGVYGHPLEVQALFFAGLRCAGELLDDGNEWRVRAEERLRNLQHHVGEYYWLDRAGLDRRRKHEQDEYGEEVVNVFNVFPESIPDWVEDWIGDEGYYAGNVGPGRIDFRFFAHGNLLTVANGMCAPERRQRLMNLYERHWDVLVGTAPLRIVHPALEGEAWWVVTGADEKNRPWSYHNGGSWPCLLWSFSNAAVACGREDLLERAVASAEERLDADQWPEYYDGLENPRPGERARRWQSWSAGAYLHAKACLEDAAAAEPYLWPSDVEPEIAHTEPRHVGGEERSGERGVDGTDRLTSR